jgi:hypothetical protein
VKLELFEELNYLDDFETVLINSKPKKAHKKLGADAFRGSIFRGVSRNKAKWQVGYKISLI